MKFFDYSKLIALCFLIFGIIQVIDAQNDTLSLKGVIVSQADNSPIIGSTIMLINIKDSTKSKYQSAGINGGFKFVGLGQAFYRLKITSIGFKPFQKIIRLQLPSNDLGRITLAVDEIAIKEVRVNEQIAPVQQKGDTTQYNAAAFKTNPDANTADLVKKMPGIVVDQDGVTANGETVQQVLLDGKRFFGQDPLLSLNTIPAEIVDKVLVYDEQSEQSKLTGFDDGNTTKTMNLITKSGKKNGKFGNVYAGAGNNDLYKAGGNLNSFKDDRRVTIIGMSNNINQQNFGQEDLVGLGGSGGRGGFRRGGNSSFITGEQDGITQTNSFGINFTDKLNKKLTVEGSYFLNSTDNNQNESLIRETFLNKGSQFYEETSKSNSSNDNHRLNLRLDYDLNDNTKLMLRSNFSLQNQINRELTTGRSFVDSSIPLSLVNNLYESKSESFNMNHNLIYQHKFKKVGRTITVDINEQTTPTKQNLSFDDFAQDSIFNYSSKTLNQNYGAVITYTEPIGSSAQFATKYEYKTTKRNSDINVFGEDDFGEQRFNSALSNDFNSNYSYHQPELSYSIRKLGSQFSVDLAYQEAILKNDYILTEGIESKQSFHSLLPSIQGRLELNSKTRLFARYSTSTSEPTISQLQNVVNNTSPLFISIGNPDLDQTYIHSLRLGARYVNSEKNISLSNFSSVQNSVNYIGENTSVLTSDSLINGVMLQRGAQLTSLSNVNGYWSAQNNTTFGIAVPKIKNNVNTSLNFRYVKTPGNLNGELNYSNAFTTTFKLGLSSNISKKIDYNIYYQILASRVENSLQNNNNSSYNTQTLAVELNLMLGKGFVFRNDTYLQNYNASNESFNTSYTLWNMGIAKKFLKNDKGELELSVFDLLGQNQNFSQNVNSRYLEEVQTEVLQQYFMLTFTYQFRKFN